MPTRKQQHNVHWVIGKPLILVVGLTLLGGVFGTQALQQNELKRAEAQLEQTAGTKLKDTWPEFRDSLCKNMTGDELNDCRIYQTQHFEKQIMLFKQN